MNNGRFETKLIQQQNRYIQQLEEQLAVYQEKDKAQERLIETLNRTLELFAEELSKARTEKEKQNP